jgi:AcrR family transcriptional regulator
MAKIDLARRAEIGVERRAKSRSQLVQAARALFSSRAIDAVTVEDVTNQAGLAKGTLYLHFQNLDELRAAVAEELTCEFHELLQPHRAAIADPVERIATGCTAFILQALRNPAWGGLTARGVWAFPPVAAVAHTRLSEDLRHAIESRRLASISVEVGFDVVVGIVLQAMRSASERRLSSPDVPTIVSAVLRALGLTADEADQIVRRVSEPRYPLQDIKQKSNNRGS